MTESFIKDRGHKLGEIVVKNLQRRHFDAYFCETGEQAKQLALSLIPEGNTVSWGGSMTLQQLGLLEAVKTAYRCIDRDSAATPQQREELTRSALICDTFLMSANGISEDGQLVNIDGNGNRAAAMIYGPKNIILIAGMNKVVKTVQDALTRARTIAAPMNMQRFGDRNTPCSKTGGCGDCTTTDCICCYQVITRVCRPAGKIKVILVNETLGF